MGRNRYNRRSRRRLGPEEERALLKARRSAAWRGAVSISVLVLSFGAIMVAAPALYTAFWSYLAVCVLGCTGVLLALAARRRGARIDASYDIPDDAEVGAPFALEPASSREVEKTRHG